MPVLQQLALDIAQIARPIRQRKATRLAIRVTIGQLKPTAREELIDCLYGIYRESSETMDRARFEQVVFPIPDTRIALFNGPNGELAGFCAAAIRRVESNSREHAVFTAGVYYRRGYRGGSASALFGLTEALRFKLQYPRVSLGYMVSASNPAVYKLLTRTMSTVYPHRARQTPTEVSALVQHVVAARGIALVDNDPWLSRSFVCPRDPARLKRSSSLAADPDVEFFLARNPRYAADGGIALLVFIPLDFINVLSGLARAARDQFTTWFSSNK